MYRRRMMISYLIKNNIKLMMRSASNVLLFIIAPVILIAMLSNAFSDLMEKYEGTDKITAGYRYEGDEEYKLLIDELVSGSEEESLILREYASGDPEEIMHKDDLSGFVVFGEDSYKIYLSEDHKNEGKILEYAIGTFYDRWTTRVAQALSSVKIETAPIELKIEHPEYMEPVDSTDYYGIIEIVYFGCCAIVCGAGLFSSEKKNRIVKKFRVSDISETKLFIAKLISMTAVVAAGSAVATALSIVLFGIHWGNPLLSALLVFLAITAATALGLMFIYVTDSMVASIILVFTVVWISGFPGGCFEKYMFSSHPTSLKLISPLYHTNRALVELSCMGKSDYVVSAIAYSVAIIAVSSAVAILVGVIRKRGRA